MHRSPEEIKTDMLNNISNTEDKSENSLIHDAIAPASIEFFGMYRELEEVGNKINIENLEAEELNQFIFQRAGLKRKLATYATTIVVISGETDTVIGEGTLVSAGDVEFETVEAKVIDKTGRVEVNVRSTIAGSTGNVPVDAIDTFDTSVPGLADVYNPEAVTNGYDEENDREFIDRYYERLQRPAKSGNVYHYEKWAKEVVGVGDARVVPRFNGPLTMKVIIIDSNKQPANEELIADVQSHIEVEMPFGVNELLVVSAKPKEINLSVNLVLTQGTDEAEVKQKIKSNLKEFLQIVAFEEEYVSFAQIGGLILATENVLDYEQLKINSGTANILIADDEVAVAGGVS